MDEKIQELRARLEELVEQQNAIVYGADSESRVPTDEEQSQLDAFADEFEHISAEIDRRERLIAQQAQLAQAQPRQTTAEGPAANNEGNVPTGMNPSAQASPNQHRPMPRVSGGDPNRPRVDHSGRNGFTNFGEFLNCAVRAGQGRQADGRLFGAATDHREALGEEGGFILPPEFRRDIMTKVFGEETLISRTDSITASGNSLVVPLDEDEPWSADGITAYWESEGGQMTSSKQTITQEQVRLNKLTAMVYLTDELIEDAPAMQSFVLRKTPEKMDHKINMALVHGDGVGKPLGILNSGALITQDAEGGQSADTLIYPNLYKMYSRMLPARRASAVWLINPELETQLYDLAFRESATDPSPAYMPAGGASVAPYGTIFGRPVLPMQVCNAIGDVGDIMFLDFGAYLTLTKGGGVRTDSSIHVRFDENVTALRFIIRVGGMPWFTSPVQPRVGTHTQSSFITLAAR